jgi:hypothetical protein
VVLLFSGSADVPYYQIFLKACFNERYGLKDGLYNVQFAALHTFHSVMNVDARPQLGDWV